MRPIDINGYLGQNTALDARQLPPGVGTLSLNQLPGYGDLRPWRSPGAAVATVTTSQQTIYRMSRGVVGTALYWLSWPGVVNATQGFDADDQDERTYFTGSGTPKFTNNNIALTGGAPYPQASRELGLPAPTGAILAAVAVAAATGTEQAFQWVYTYGNDIGWESAPSPPSNALLSRPGTTFDLSGFTNPPIGNYAINKIRVYRFVPGADTAGAYFFFREFPVGATPANPIDDARSTDTDPIATIGWRPCPGIPNGGATNLTEPTAYGLTRLWNGMLAVLSGKSMRISEPYIHYAWPLAYEVAVTDEPVAIGVYGQRALILTKGDAVLVAGSSPDSMDDEALKINRPCLSARSVVSFNEGSTVRGVAWASDEGLVWYGEGGLKLLTDKIVPRDEWQAMDPSSMIAARFESFYVCSYLGANKNGVREGFVVDVRERGFYPLSAGYTAMFLDPATSRLFVLDAGSIRQWDAGAAMTTTFRSKVVRLPSPMNIGVVEVIASSYPATVRLFYDGALFYTGTATSDEPMRPPGGVLPDEVQAEVITAGRVLAVRLARSADDLRET